MDKPITEMSEKEWRLHVLEFQAKVLQELQHTGAGISDLEKKIDKLDGMVYQIADAIQDLTEILIQSGAIPVKDIDKVKKTG